MAFWESILVALDALRANKLRSVLTMLGVIVGVCSVVIMVSIVQGLRHKVVDQFESLGSNLIFVVYQPDRHQNGAVGAGTLQMEDMKAIEQKCSLVGSVSGTASVGVTAHVGARSKTLSLSGVPASYATTQNVELSRGRFIDEADEQEWSKACVLGRTTARDLFGSENPIGRPVVCDVNGTRVTLTVVGTLAEKDSGMGGQNFNDGMFVALRSVQKRFLGNVHLDAITAKAISAFQTQAGADQVWEVLKRRHPDSYKNYVVDTSEGLLTKINQVMGIFQLVLGGIAGLSLLTGGIGIMNIMLVSVTERTREIGVRMAVGAPRSAILTQFLVEAMSVSGLGGLIGIGMGCGIAAIIDAFAHKNLPTYVPFWAIALSFGFSVSVGLCFGIYPAYKASRLNPVEALRYE